MAYSEELANRVREILAGEDPEEKKMFGGVAFMVKGHMTVGVLDDALMVRVGAENWETALEETGTEKTLGNFRPMKGILWVDSTSIQSTRGLSDWIQRGLAYSSSLPPKSPKS